jgi:hypothetical protein
MWRREIKEAKEDRSRPYEREITEKELEEEPVDEEGVMLKKGDRILFIRRQRKRENGRDEKPWPRDYQGEILSRERKIENERLAVEADPFTIRRRENIRQIQQQHDFFGSLVETITNLQPQTCTVCLDDNVFTISN